MTTGTKCDAAIEQPIVIDGNRVASLADANSMGTRQWICAQQGGREHYAIPRALASVGHLDKLITDVWVTPKSPISAVPMAAARRMSKRFHSEIDRRNVQAFNSKFMWLDFARRFTRADDEAFFTERNDVFDRLAASALDQIVKSTASSNKPIVFSYAHASRQLFQCAKKHGCETILGQFDPGPIEADIVDQEHAAHPEFKTRWRRYSSAYVDRWLEEVQLADRIVVNSSWSQECLGRYGISAAKLSQIPLVYISPNHTGFERQYPNSFNRTRPLRLLFLGQVILRKGIARLFEAARLLKEEPIELRLVGPTDITNLATLMRGLPISWSGSVPRGDVDRHYQEADVLIFPTLSDGFAITQLEAQEWKLPVITTNRCGNVIRNNDNGIVLDDPTPDKICQAIVRILREPRLLADMSSRSHNEQFGLDRLARELNALATCGTL